jgi:hypothetical protein
LAKGGKLPMPCDKSVDSIAINFVPLADDAIESQFGIEAPICVHVWATAKLTIIEMAATNPRILTGFMVRPAN